jgi:hypothetical protein
MDKLDEVVEDLFGLHYNTNLEGMSDMISEDSFMNLFDAEVADKLDTQEVWIKTMEKLKSEEDKDNAWQIFNMFLKEKLVRLGL